MSYCNIFVDNTQAPIYLFEDGFGTTVEAIKAESAQDAVTQFKSMYPHAAERGFKDAYTFEVIG